MIGNVHEKTKPALKLLEKEGFEHRGYVDLFDAGPTVEAKLGNIRSIRESQVCPITIGELEHISQHSSDTLAVCNQGVSGFRATFTQHAHYNHAKHTLVISQEVADALNLSQGDAARFFRL